MNQIDTSVEPAFACNMAAFTTSQRQAHIENTAQLLSAVQKVTEQANGYRLEFALTNERWLEAAEFVGLERLCCPFFSFSLEIQPSTDVFWLNLSGPAGVKPFIQAELGVQPS